MNNKILGSLALAGAPFFLLSGYLQPYCSFLHEQQFYGAWGIVYLTGWMCSIRGLQRLQATGSGKWGRGLLWVLLGSLGLATLSNAVQLFDPGNRSLLFIVLDAFWPVSNLLMGAAAITVAVAGRLNGWRRFVPLLAGAWLPVLVVCAAVFGRTGVTGTIAGVYSAIAWSVLALMIRSTPEAHRVVYVGRPAPATEAVPVA
ncbi:MAG TPA: hypothetical protein VHK69_01305 [Chitinophagaceae bacterium]|jgi:hypothetical protein|nr:hypothetical protein [Chitinophagaceae bacterium]